MKRFLLILAAFASFCGCKSTKALLPSVSGKAGEIIVVIDKPVWEGPLGGEVRDLLACDCPFFIQQEPLYSLVNVTPSAFADLFKVHRNIFMVMIDPQVDSAGVFYKHDAWAAPQCVIQLSARNEEEASGLLAKSGRNITNSFEQAERDRVIRNSIKYEEREVTNQVKEVFGGSPRIPVGYKLRKISDDFAWISDDKQYSNQGIFIYRYPADEEDPFSKENIVAHMNDILKENVPGMLDNSWMTTSDYFEPQLEYIKYKGRSIAQTRGYWEVENDFMGGPFVSHSFYSQDGKDIIVLDAWVYAPKYDKRQYLRQTEAIIYSWEWKDSLNKESK